MEVDLLKHIKESGCESGESSGDSTVLSLPINDSINKLCEIIEKKSCSV
jgi:hypothetical protein